jgi:diacylglycerol kinase (ATP)
VDPYAEPSTSRLARLENHRDRVLVSVNPKAGAKCRRKDVDHLETLLNESGYRAQIITDLDELAASANAARESGDLRAVVAAGGDGTAATIANLTRPDTPIMLMPQGTENLLAKYLGIDPSPEFILSAIKFGATLEMDAGLADDRIFLLMLGVGFDADVVRRLHERRSGHIHQFSYVKPILDSIRKYQYPKIRVIYDLGDDDAEGEQTQQVTAKWAFVANLPRYARGLRIVPQAVGTDGQLDLCTFGEGSLWHGLLYLSRILIGQHQSWGSCHTARTARLRIESDDEVPYQLDGDPGGHLPVDVEVLPRRVTLVTPRKWLEDHGGELEHDAL